VPGKYPKGKKQARGNRKGSPPPPLQVSPLDDEEFRKKLLARMQQGASVRRACLLEGTSETAFYRRKQVALAEPEKYAALVHFFEVEVPRAQEFRMHIAERVLFNSMYDHKKGELRMGVEANKTAKWLLEHYEGDQMKTATVKVETSPGASGDEASLAKLAAENPEVQSRLDELMRVLTPPGNKKAQPSS